MNQPTDFFVEFPPVSKTDWIHQILKDLKGKPIDDLRWLLDDMAVDPFGHADDLPVPPRPLLAQAGGWEINEDIVVSDPVAANALALEGLNAGTESLTFVAAADTNFKRHLNELLESIHPDYISLHWAGSGFPDGPAVFLAAMADLGAVRNLPASALRGSLHYDPAAESSKIHDWRYVAETIEYAQSALPGFRCITVDGQADFGSPEHTVAELAALLRKGNFYLEKLTERGLRPGEVADQLQFSLHVGKSYFAEIAKLRAFKILWSNVLRAWHVAPSYPVLDVRFAPQAYGDDLYTNMIRATTMAMSAVLGGATRLTVAPYDQGREARASYPPAFARRIARNVQHLLKAESGFAELADPAAGSYYIEKLTGQFAEAAWAKFSKSPHGA